MITLCRDAIETAGVDRRARRHWFGNALHCGINWPCSDAAGRGAGAFARSIGCSGFLCRGGGRRDFHPLDRQLASLHWLSIVTITGDRISSSDKLLSRDSRHGLSQKRFRNDLSNRNHGGSDGARTRELRRDRPAILQ